MQTIKKCIKIFTIIIAILLFLVSILLSVIFFLAYKHDQPKSLYWWSSSPAHFSHALLKERILFYNHDHNGGSCKSNFIDLQGYYLFDNMHYLFMHHVSGEIDKQIKDADMTFNTIKKKLSQAEAKSQITSLISNQRLRISGIALDIFKKSCEPWSTDNQKNEFHKLLNHVASQIANEKIHITKALRYEVFKLGKFAYPVVQEDHAVAFEEALFLKQYEQAYEE